MRYLSCPASCKKPAGDGLPVGHDAESPLPLVLSLHEYGLHYEWQDSYFGLSALVESHNFALLLPNGVRDGRGQRFWNATDYCCGDQGSRVDDFRSLRGLVEEAEARVFVVGFSNGAYMSYRLACDSFPGLEAVAVLAGASYSDPARPVSVPHMHGTADRSVE